MTALVNGVRELRSKEIDGVSGAQSEQVVFEIPSVGDGWYGFVDESWGSAGDWTTTGVGYDSGNWSISAGTFESTREDDSGGFQVTVTIKF